MKEYRTRETRQTVWISDFYWCLTSVSLKESYKVAMPGFISYSSDDIDH